VRTKSAPARRPIHFRAVETPCSTACARDGEPLAGTAGAPAALVAFSWPKRLWHADDVARSERLPPAIAELVAAETAAGRELSLRAFQRTPGQPTDRVELLLVAPGEGRAAHEREVPTGELPERIERFLTGGSAADAPPVEPLLLVCTDGRHDRCCAEWGRRTFEAVRAEVERQRAPFALAESSHLGGHRFAATCLALPDGRMHGRLRPEDAPALVRALAEGGTLPGRYRGRLGFGEAEQAAEAWAHARWPGSRAIAVTRVSASGEAAAVRVSAGARAAEVRLERRGFASATSCGTEAPAEPRPRWVVVSARRSPRRT
jgi:hypothetical protein